MTDPAAGTGAVGLRRRLHWLAGTPFHPQWLMPGRQVAAPLRTCRGTVLDIGSADRWLRAELAPDVRYLALDYPVTANDLYGTRPDVYADARRLPLADCSIDAVACFEVLEHVVDPEAVAAEIARVLKTGGVAALSMPFLYPVHDAPHDYQRWTAYGLSRSLARAGLQVESLEVANHPLHTGAVLAALALTGPLQAARGWRRVLGLSVVAVAVPVINLGAWLLAFVWPRWDAMTTTHHVVARKA